MSQVCTLIRVKLEKLSPSFQLAHPGNTKLSLFFLLLAPLALFDYYSAHVGFNILAGPSNPCRFTWESTSPISKQASNTIPSLSGIMTFTISTISVTRLTHFSWQLTNTVHTGGRGGSLVRELSMQEMAWIHRVRCYTPYGLNIDTDVNAFIDNG